MERMHVPIVQFYKYRRENQEMRQQAADESQGPPAAAEGEEAPDESQEAPAAAEGEEAAHESQETAAAAEGEEVAAVSSEAQVPPSSAAREEASPPPFAAGEDQPPPREAAAAGGTTTAVANLRLDARQPQHGSFLENLVWWILFCGPPMRPADEAAAGADEGGQTAPVPAPALAPAPAPADESLLRKICRESREMMLEGKGELKIEEAFRSKPHPDCSPEFAAILHAADAAFAAAAARGQSKSSSSSSSSASPSPSGSEPKIEKEKGKEKKKERDPAGN